MDGITERTEEPPFRERFTDVICGFQAHILFLLGIEVVFLVIALFSLLFVDPSTTAYALLQFDFIILFATLIPAVWILYKCSNRTW